MDNFRKKLIIRVLKLVAGLVVALCATIFFFTSFGDRLRPGHYSHIDSNVGLFYALTAIILFTVSILLIIRNIEALRNPDQLQKLYISEIDERNIFIKQKTGPLGMNIIMFMLAITAIIVGNFSGPVFCILLYILLFVTLLRGILILYYRNKY
jgi:hypothetical protein